MSACAYVARNAAGDVLYVGSTGNLVRRLADHARGKPWWSEVADVESIPAANRAAAFDLERRHIQRLQPIYNKRGVTPPKVVSRNADAPTVRMRAETWANLIGAVDGPERILADQMGVNYMTFSGYKRGVAFPSSKFIAAAIVTTGLTFDDLFYVEQPTAPAEQWCSRRRARAT